jgi:uncharacterized protein YjbJ (UPF0337 family)
MADATSNPEGNMLEGGWKQFKGKVREKWGDITDNDLERLKGRKDQLAGMIQQRVGHDSAQVRNELDRMAAEARYRFEK